MNDFGQALNQEARRRDLKTRIAKAPVGEGFAVYGQDQTGENSPEVVAESLQNMVNQKIRRKLTPRWKTDYKEEDGTE